ncbi:ABC transporter substrate-binding protein [Oceanibaculum pacificum]|uniref:ABC transporter substrate-binding protein n=1 Tax=Oceanibaculum pacificum TaxID=580166 RepID=A0A154WG76_9PROT|nr:ABC transporter substrate-binding protein [Oceanibaculum pacificum]KZD12533.1 ABC transporter substrate-binding protein [Oceanibaculum pacificum]
MRRRILSAAALAAVLATGLAAAPASAKELRWAFSSDTASLDPMGHNVTFTYSVLSNVYEGLIRRTPDLKIEPSLATKWEMVEPTRWRFHLRKGVKFHNGNDFNADDVIFSYNRINHVDSNLRDRVAGVAEAIKVDDYTVDFVTKKPDPIMMSQWDTFFIMDKEWSEANNATVPTNLTKGVESYAGRNSNGTGAFIITERTADVRTVFEPNPNWWDKPQHNLTKVTMTPIQQAATRVAALLSGEIDMMFPAPLQDIDRINSNKGTRVISGPELRTIFLGFDQFREKALGTNTDKNPYLDVKVRKAIYHAIDIELIKTRIMRNSSDPTSIMISPKLFPLADQVKRYPYDPEMAKKLLAEAGYPNGFETRLDCTNDRYVNDAQICQAMTAMLARVGIKVNMRAYPNAQYFSDINRPKQDFALYMLGWTPSTFDSHNVLYNLMASWDESTGRGRVNYGDFKNDRINEITGLIVSETDTDKRNKLILEAYQIMHENAYYVPLHQQSVVWAARDNVELAQRADDQFHFNYVTIK